VSSSGGNTQEAVQRRTTIGDSPDRTEDNPDQADDHPGAQDGKDSKGSNGDIKGNNNLQPATHTEAPKAVQEESAAQAVLAMTIKTVSSAYLRAKSCVLLDRTRRS
jgi:hypothetical protein